jgi:ABC-type Fe3+/spermidine/putrescine transport system ATPase subunit
MDHGNVVQIGTPEEIYEQPATRFVAQFVGHANILDGTVIETGSGGASVRCGALSFYAEGPVPVQPGQSVAIALRYERTLLAPDGQGIRGSVMERSFLGDAVRIAVQTEDGTILNADIPTGQGTITPPIGSAIQLGWRNADLRLLTH